MRVAAIIPAAGAGRRLKSKTAKPLVKIFGKPLIIYTLKNLKRAFSFFEIILVAAPSNTNRIRRLLAHEGLKEVKIIPGGKTRSESVRNGLKNVSGKCDWVLVHDAARPLVAPVLVRRLLQEAKKEGAAIAAFPVASTVKRVDKRKRIIQGTEDRARLFLAQTPQVFRKDLLERQYRLLGNRAFSMTDEAALFDGSPTKVKVVLGNTDNIKITTPEDLEIFKFYLKRA